MLGLQAKTGAMRVRFSVFACSGAVEEVAAIKLDARLGGQHIQDSAAGSFEYFGGHLQAASFTIFKHPIVIVSLPEFQLLVFGIDPRADGGGFPEVKRRAGHGAHFPGWNQGRIHRSELCCVKH